MIRYDKLVRDNIPAMIERDGARAVTRILQGAEYRARLEEKLDEEVAEFHRSGELEELADVLEVVYALCAAQGRSVDELNAVCRKKRDERGGFGRRVFLIGKEERT